MNFLKNIFGKESSKKQGAEEAPKNEARPSQEEKEAHDKDHNGENKKSPNVCEFC